MRCWRDAVSHAGRGRPLGWRNRPGRRGLPGFALPAPGKHPGRKREQPPWNPGRGIPTAGHGRLIPQNATCRMSSPDRLGGHLPLSRTDRGNPFRISPGQEHPPPGDPGQRPLRRISPGQGNPSRISPGQKHPPHGSPSREHRPWISPGRERPPRNSMRQVYPNRECPGRMPSLPDNPYPVHLPRSSHSRLRRDNRFPRFRENRPRCPRRR